MRYTRALMPYPNREGPDHTERSLGLVRAFSVRCLLDRSVSLWPPRAIRVYKKQTQSDIMPSFTRDGNKRQRQKTYLRTYTPSEDLDQPVHSDQNLNRAHFRLPRMQSFFMPWARACQTVYVRFLTLWPILRRYCHYKNNLLKYIENFTTKNWNCSDKNSDSFHISAQKHILRVLVRTASSRLF